MNCQKTAMIRIRLGVLLYTLVGRFWFPDYRAIGRARGAGRGWGSLTRFWGGPTGQRQAKAKAIEQSFRLRLHSGLRQSGDAFGVAFIRRAEALRFRPKCIGAGRIRRGNGKSNGNPPFAVRLQRMGHPGKVGHPVTRKEQ